MTKAEFDAVLDKWVNKEIFKKEDGFWVPKLTCLSDDYYS